MESNIIEKKKVTLKKQIVETNILIDKKVITKKPVAKKSTAEPKKKSVKKEFLMEGQTKATPPENDSLRKFYTSLLKQNKKSEMALKWCIEHGLLPEQKDSIYVSLKSLSIS
jgi:hypothetical protein